MELDRTWQRFGAILGAGGRFKGRQDAHISQPRLAKSRARWLCRIWYCGDAVPTLWRLVGTKKHVIVPKSPEMTVGDFAAFD